MADKIKYIQTNEHAMVGGSEKPLAPGDRVLLDEENDSHKHLVKLIEAEDPSVEHLSLVEVEPGADKKADEEKAEQLKEAAKIAAKVRDEEVQEANKALEEQEAAQEDSPPVPQLEGVDLPPQDEEAVSLAEQSGAGQRASTQEDAEEQGAKSGRRSARRTGGK